MAWAQAAMAGANALGSMMGDGGGAAMPISSTAGNHGAVTIGGLNMDPRKSSIDLSDPMTAAMVGGGVLLFGAVLLKAVK